MIVFNPSQAAVFDYPIENPQTKEVNLWSINPGETIDFPDYVAEYLLQIYGFLQRVVTQEEVDREREEKEKIDKGRKFSQVKIVKAEGVEVVRPPSGVGFTNQIANTPASPYPEIKEEVAKQDEQTGNT